MIRYKAKTGLTPIFTRTIAEKETSGDVYRRVQINDTLKADECKQVPVKLLFRII